MRLNEALNNEKMIDLNYQIDELGRSPRNVAREFLIKEGLIQE